MNLQQRLYIVALEGLKQANRNPLFWTKSQAMALVNITRKGV